MKIFKIMLPVIAFLAVGTGYANKNDVNNNANKNDVKVAEQHNSTTAKNHLMRKIVFYMKVV